MSEQHRRSGFTWVELVVVLLIVVVAVGLLLPGIQAAREAARLASCNSNLKQWGLALHNYHDANRRLPPSCGVSRDAAGKITATDGWSWMVHCLPFMEYQNLYNTLDVDSGRPLVEPAGAVGTPHAQALRTLMAEGICPTYRGSPYVNASQKEAITNYKAMGATHIESLTVATDAPLVPKYDPSGLDARGNPRHPDGALFPGSTTCFADFGQDGSAHTILVAETVEPRFARWTVGAEATVVGLPGNVEFEAVPGQSYYAPKGTFVGGKWDEETTVNPEYRTYLNWNCEKFPYDGGNGSKGGKYGPSSHHPSVVNHLFGDGAVRSISKDVDPAAYMFGITRAGGDPTPPWFTQ
jgi:type II secretory pathway pseudopilin PulG